MSDDAVPQTTACERWRLRPPGQSIRATRVREDSTTLRSGAPGCRGRARCSIARCHTNTISFDTGVANQRAQIIWGNAATRGHPNSTQLERNQLVLKVSLSNWWHLRSHLTLPSPHSVTFMPTARHSRSAPAYGVPPCHREVSSDRSSCTRLIGQQQIAC